MISALKNQPIGLKLTQLRAQKYYVHHIFDIRQGLHYELDCWLRTLGKKAQVLYPTPSHRQNPITCALFSEHSIFEEHGSDAPILSISVEHFSRKCVELAKLRTPFSSHIQAIRIHVQTQRSLL